MSAKDYFSTSILATDEDVEEQKKRDLETLKLLEADTKKSDQSSTLTHNRIPGQQTLSSKENSQKQQARSTEAPPLASQNTPTAALKKQPLESEQTTSSKPILKPSSASQKTEEKDRDSKKGVKFDENVKKSDAPPKEPEEPPKRVSLFKQRMLGNN